MLTVRVEQADERREERGGQQLHTRQVQVWERSVRLPTDVQAERAETVLRDGELTITLPKAPPSGVRRRSTRP